MFITLKHHLSLAMILFIIYIELNYSKVLKKIAIVCRPDQSPSVYYLFSYLYFLVLKKQLNFIFIF